MNQHLVNFQLDAASVDSELSYRRQIREDEGEVSPIVVAHAMGEALRHLHDKMADADLDDVLLAFRRGLVG